MRSLAVVVLACALGGCSTSSKTLMEGLQNSVEGYNEAYRWKNYERAAGFLPADLRAAFLDAYRDDDNSLQIDDYSIVKVDLENDASAKVTIRVSYIQLPSVTVEKATLVQHWKRLGGEWILETEDNSLRKIEPASAPAEAPAWTREAAEPGDEARDEEREAPEREKPGSD